MKYKNIDLSFIIPAYNEELLIQDTINSIHRYTPVIFHYEITIVDHDSTDRTSCIASELGANVLKMSGGSIASVRNFGASFSKGRILIFLDADILLTAKWMQHIQNAIVKIKNNKNILTGSWVSIPDSASWIEKHWYAPLQHGDNTHINTGHLIIAKDYFFEMGGFSEHLETGEDYEFSMRVNSAGGKISDDANLVVVHKGFPTSLYQFVRREFWHGKGDTRTIKEMLKSKVVVLSIFFLVLHAILVIGVMSGQWHLTGLSALIILIIIAVSSIFKYKKAPVLSIVTNCFLYYLYFWARSISLLVFFRSKRIGKHHR